MPDQNRPRFWLSRLIVAMEVLCIIVVISWFEPDSMTARAISSSGGFAWALLAALGACCLISIADVIVNDLMPARFSMPWALHWRHLGQMGMALLLAVIGVLVVFRHGFTPVLFAYWLNAVLSAGLTFLDAFSRLRQP